MIVNNAHGGDSLEIVATKSIAVFEWNKENVLTWARQYAEKYVGLMVTEDNLPDMESANKELSSKIKRLEEFRKVNKAQLEARNAVLEETLRETRAEVKELRAQNKEIRSQRDKIAEELAEVAEAIDDTHRHEEVGDLLFAVANYARKLGVDPEAALRDANAKFARRFAAMEAIAGGSLQGLSLDEQQAHWQTVKVAERS